MLPNINSSDYPRAFAKLWIANWNRRDVEAVLSHFHPNCTFESPIAQSVVERGRFKGVAELRSYWETAHSGIQPLKFTLDVIC